MIENLFKPDDDKTFVQLVIEHLGKGAATKRKISAHDYVHLAREKWMSCEKDNVYLIKVLIDPLVQPEIAAELPSDWVATGDPFCELIAGIDSNGNLIGASQDYVPPSYPGVYLAHIVAGSPIGGIVPDSAEPTEYLVAFLDVLGFEALLKNIGLDALIHKYEELLVIALGPNSESRPWSVGLTDVQGQPTVGLMWLPIQTAYFSDSLLLWVNYHPSHVHEFLDRCSRVFCQAIAIGLPLRGAISVGRVLLDKKKGIYLGSALIEAVRLENKFNWIGIALGTSWKSEELRIPIPPDRVFLYQPPQKDEETSLFSELVLDWPRVWRESRKDSAIDFLRELCHPKLPENVKAKYEAAVSFYEYSQANQDWFLPIGTKRYTPRNLNELGQEPNKESAT